MSGGRWTKKVPEFIYFVGEDGNWIQGPYVHPHGNRDRKFKLVEVKEKPKKKE